MKRMTLGAIAIASTLTFACTTTTETETREPGGTAPAAASPPAKPDDPASSLRTKLALSKSGSHASTIAALAGKVKSLPAPKLKSGAGGGSCGLSTGDATCDACLD